jgi:acid stress-induced BolA-like protein IbaG/YrbA
MTKLLEILSNTLKKEVIREEYIFPLSSNDFKTVLNPDKSISIVVTQDTPVLSLKDGKIKNIMNRGTSLQLVDSQGTNYFYKNIMVQDDLKKGDIVDKGQLIGRVKDRLDISSDKSDLIQILTSDFEDIDFPENIDGLFT